MFVCRPPIYGRRFECLEIAGGLKTRTSIDVKLNLTRPPFSLFCQRAWKPCAARVLALLHFSTSYDVSTHRRANRLRQLTPCERHIYCVSATSHVGVD
jgi:hypothetical protein